MLPTMPQLPSDNLYKWLATGGTIATLASFISINWYPPAEPLAIYSLIFLFVFGACVGCGGFYHWYFKLQLIQDLIVQAELDWQNKRLANEMIQITDQHEFEIYKGLAEKIGNILFRLTIYVAAMQTKPQADKTLLAEVGQKCASSPEFVGEFWFWKLGKCVMQGNFRDF